MDGQNKKIQTLEGVEKATELEECVTSAEWLPGNSWDAPGTGGWCGGRTCPQGVLSRGSRKTPCPQ